MSGPGFICVEPDGICELCGVVAELRPYGPNGERICFECGQKDPETTDRKIAEHIFGIKDFGKVQK